MGKRQRVDPGTYAQEHLAYEVWMVSGLVDRFTRFEPLLNTPSRSSCSPSGAELEVLDLVGRNADIESFAMHSRVLVHILYGTKDGNKDCVASDFFEFKHEWPELRPKQKPKALKDVNLRPVTGTEEDP